MKFRPALAGTVPRRMLSVSVLLAALAVGACFGDGESFTEPDCDPPIDVLEPEDPSNPADSIRTPSPVPNPDYNPCPAPNV